ncbi:lytic polysaccharide monooxygenase [Aaosphaeria arxii CBS 175.79]|uniref:lytic cellulose monooxygenase (C4-dehydrogenating) n=1 Tax=Aaosphaeria arxii CBS 175.79 TaxID=1450172 RepID=A0A6A5Y9T5_9PLEO|nr:lytic polysaccharide monooxygenase [Aaosphaeria arxii CBS 175.79]KAF2021983.1 lytic polysaccharide monooxygenase [Aaosphaeria arxii CBS 175.79]
MKYLFSAAALLATATAHYTFPALIAGGSSTGTWSHVRKTANYQSNGPVTDVNSNAIRCYELAPGTPSQTYTVKAGDTVGFVAAASISHPGPLQFYLAKVPAGKTAADWDGSGNVWFKIYEQGATISSAGMSWGSQGKSQVTVQLPKSLPSGEYLFRVEHIGLHSASAAGGAQFYISCAQLKVTDGGNGTPGPLVSFPGAYSANDAGIKLNIYYPVPSSYTPPGPRPWAG